MAVDPKEDLVERAYAALDADDVPALLELFTEDAMVEYPAPGSLPYGGEWRGHEGIARFLDLHDETEEILEFEPRDMEAVSRPKPLAYGCATGPWVRASTPRN